MCSKDVIIYQITTHSVVLSNTFVYMISAIYDLFSQSLDYTALYYNIIEQNYDNLLIQ